ncbi:MAG: hypothetical protein QNJ62_07885 [Methyloceanibacter sp.]|nr:hypothetical protein [Methyloceanibacter sp.]
MWWITYRGEGRRGVDNIGVFEDSGAPRAKHPLLLDPSANARPLHIARGFALAGDDLYIANAWRKDSYVARYRREGNLYRFADIVVSTEHVEAMVHPFDLELGDDGHLYVSCQDTNTVIAIVPERQEPAPVAAHLRHAFPQGNFLPGTRVASSQGRLPEVEGRAPIDVPSPLGLEVVLNEHGRPRHSVRGIVAYRGYLYVADQAADAVKIFELSSGRLRASIRGKEVRKPVHLLLRDETLYIGAAGSGSIVAYDITQREPHGLLSGRVVIDGALHAPSGLAIGPDGDLYVAERRKRCVRRFSREGADKGVFIEELPDRPEFMLHIPDAAA